MNTKSIWRLFSLIVAAAMVLSLIPGCVTHETPIDGTPAQPARVAIGAHQLAGTHLVPPAQSVLMAELSKAGLPLDASPEQIKAAEEAWFTRFHKQSDTWVNPGFEEWVIERERSIAEGGLISQAIVPVTATVFYLAVDFGATETFTIPMEQDDGTCVTETHTITGPLKGLIPPPPATDNFTLWYSPTVTADAKFYEKLLFGYEGAGRVRMDLTDPDDGQPGINLSGYTMQDYYDNVAGVGNVVINGAVEGWVTVPHSEGYYGADDCATGSHGGGAGVPVPQLVIDAVQVFSQTNPGYWTDPNFWPSFDGNGDGIIDSFGIIHAGEGQEGGGGAEGSFALWSHSSDLRYYWPEGFKVYEGDPNTTDDDIVIGPYTMQPEPLDVGVLCEEFGHNFFGLPDLYTNDANNSIGDWNIMSGGAWLGWLGGSVPASMPLWFKMIAAFDVGGTIVPVNWHEPMVTRSYDDPTADIVIGQLEKTPDGVNKGVRVNLPPYSEITPNMAGDGKAAYSGTGRNNLDALLTRSITIGTGASGILTMDAYWDIEEDWDYGYVEINGVPIADMDGVTTNDDPNGNNRGNGITGYDDGTLRFDLSSYAGSTVTLGLRYQTDPFVTEAGWWVDNIQLDGALIDDFEGAAAPGTFAGWTNSTPGWYVVPMSNSYPQYYLVEWRTMTDYDQMIAKTAYIHNLSDEVNGSVVSRIPYNMPAALLYYRNTKYSSTYEMAPNRGDPPSLGSKYQLLIVDQNWWPVRIGDTLATYEGYWTGRVSSYDAGLTLQTTQAFTIPEYFGIPGEGPWAYPSKPAVDSFNDTLGYYGGYWLYNGGLYWMERDGSAVIPARGPYSTRIQNFDGNPLYAYYGYPWAPSWLGSGNPGGDSYGSSVQYGVNIDLLSKAGDDAYNSTATLRFRNYSIDFSTTITPVVMSDTISVTYQTVVENVGKETAHDIELYYELDSQLTLSSGYTTSLTLATLDAGTSTVVTVVAEMPITARTVNLYSELWANDGQVDRGPWWLDSRIDTGLNFIYLPIVFK